MKLVQLYATRPSRKIMLRLMKYKKYSSLGYIFIHNDFNEKHSLMDPLRKTYGKMSRFLSQKCNKSHTYNFTFFWVAEYNSKTFIHP